MTDPHTALITADEEAPTTVDWVRFARPLWAARRTILSGALALGALAASAVLLLSKFESEGLYQLHVPSVRTTDAGSSISLGSPGFSEYKIIASLVSEPVRMGDYLVARGMAEDDDVAGLPGAFKDPAKLRQLIAPVYTYTKADAKEFVENPASREAAAQLVGLRVAASARTGEVAQKRSKLLAEYVRDTAFVQGLTDYVRFRDNEQRRATLSYDNSVIRDRYRLKVASDRLRELRSVGSRNPEARTDGRAVLSLTDSTIRFLPIPTQVAAVEIGTVDVNIEMERARRERDQAEYSATYFQSLQKAMASAKTAEDVLKAMPVAKQDADKGRDLTDEKYKQISNATQIEILTVQDAFYNRSRFISGPTLPERSLKMPVVALVLGTLAGLGLTAGLVLLGGWLRDNKARIVMANTNS